MALLKDDAVCIRHWDWSETSQTVSLFTRDHGVLRGLAKGSRRENSRFSGGLEILTRGEVLAVRKSHDSLATLTAWDLLEVFPAIRASLTFFYASMFMADLVHRAVRDDDPHPRLYDALVVALRAGGALHAPHQALLAFQWAALVETGYQPELDRDHASGAPLPEAPSYAFVARLGGLVPDGAPAGRDDGERWRVRAETVRLLRRLRDAGSGEGHSAEALLRANRLLAAYSRTLFGPEPDLLQAIFTPNPA